MNSKLLITFVLLTGVAIGRFCSSLVSEAVNAADKPNVIEKVSGSQKDKVAEIDSQNNAVLTDEQAQKALQENAVKRGNTCMEECRKICEKYRCDLVPRIVIQGDKVSSEVVVTPKM